MHRDGVSRASAYHHYGMVSPFKYARDIHSHSSSGARRLADEFFTWRSVAYVYCFHRWPAIDTLEVSSLGPFSVLLHIRLPTRPVFDVLKGVRSKHAAADVQLQKCM